MSALIKSDSVFILSPLVEAIVSKSGAPITELLEVIKSRKNKTKSNRRVYNSQHSSTLYDTLPDRSLRRCLEVASEKGASSWLTTIPIAEHGFHLHKGAFRDAICLRYGLTPPHLPTECVCGSPFSVDHAMNCKRGGFPFIRHNELRDITAELHTEVCPDVMIEPSLQPLSGECFNYRSANTEKNARADIAPTGFWSPSHRSFFDVRVYNPFASVYSKSKLKACHRRNELEKRRQYDERIRTVELGSFTPLVFTTAGGMGQSATTFYSFLSNNP